MLLRTRTSSSITSIVCIGKLILARGRPRMFTVRPAQSIVYKTFTASATLGPPTGTSGGG